MPGYTSPAVTSPGCIDFVQQGTAHMYVPCTIYAPQSPGVSQVVTSRCPSARSTMFTHNEIAWLHASQNMFPLLSGTGLGLYLQVVEEGSRMVEEMSPVLDLLGVR